MQRVDHLSRGIAPADSLRRQSVNLGECAGHKDIGRALRQFQPKVILVRLQIFGIRLIEHEQDVLWQRAMQTRSEEHTSELQSLMRISYAVFCLKKKNKLNPKQEQYGKHETTRTVKSYSRRTNTNDNNQHTDAHLSIV